MGSDLSTWRGAAVAFGRKRLSALRACVFAHGLIKTTMAAARMLFPTSTNRMGQAATRPERRGDGGGWSPARRKPEDNSVACQRPSPRTSAVARRKPTPLAVWTNPKTFHAESEKNKQGEKTCPNPQMRVGGELKTLLDGRLMRKCLKEPVNWSN